MTIEINAQGAERKHLVQTISKWLDIPAKYCGAPTFAYEVGPVTVDKGGSLTITDVLDSEAIERLLQRLSNEGFVVAEDDDTAVNPTGLCVSIPRGWFTETTLENLKNLIDSKGNLIKKALGVTDLPILTTEEKVSFPWFTADLTPEEIKAYNNFICKLCEMAKTQKRVTAKEKDVANEKYTFRCFLLRLGFIGAEYKEDRKILLRNLSGSSAFKSNTPTKAADLQPEPPGAYDIIPDGMDPAMAEAIADAILIQEVNALMLIECQDDLAVRARLELILSCIAPTNFLMIIYLAVHCQHHLAVSRIQGLST